MEQQNWAAKLLGYNFEIVYKPGKENRGADALSKIEEGNVVRFSHRVLGSRTGS
ncbi:RNA-directed DNA polymerase (Reverse transcriptase) [Trifolium medium]|uniref:RNA-directed DNA polymerase (Reverse transcriptase) n=1 Tax=Trifolium medium TaxID=97028 RepID=A0A392S3D4_9FABA|nr:RNA-directed DNA polymerase (Reverse transcriptase) [Trifolium medium]